MGTTAQEIIKAIGLDAGEMDALLTRAFDRGNDVEIRQGRDGTAVVMEVRRRVIAKIEGAVPTEENE